MTRDEHFEKLKDFVIRQTYIDDEPISGETSLENDLGVTGADAIELMVAYGTHFKVDVSKFMAAYYFNAEGELIFFRSRMKPFTVGHLLKGVLAGRLNEEVINS